MRRLGRHDAPEAAVDDLRRRDAGKVRAKLDFSLTLPQRLTIDPFDSYGAHATSTFHPQARRRAWQKACALFSCSRWSH